MTMIVSTLVSAHSKPDVVLDTIDSIKIYMTDNILLIVDGASSEFDSLEFPVTMIKGFPHSVPRSPFRNMALGLMNLVDKYPDSDWYCYIEYDCLVTSARFKANLEKADELNVWMLGNDGHVDNIQLPIIESLIGSPLRSSYYLLGACQFFSKHFIKKLIEIDFFQRFLNLTNGFSDGLFPYYSGYDINEHLYPTLTRHFGGNIGVFATYDYTKSKWHGSYEIFPVRWQPELDPDTENFSSASLIHPLKTFNHPIREHHRRIRNVIRSSSSVRPSFGHFISKSS